MSRKRCQYMVGAPGAEEPAAWCRLDADHGGDHDLDYDYDRTDEDRDRDALADINMACTCLIEDDTPEANGAWDMRGCPVHDIDDEMENHDAVS